MTLRRIVLHNFGWKLFSFGLAVLTWMLIHYSIHNPTQNPGEQRTVKVPIRVIKLADDGRVYKITPDEAEVTISGDEALLRNLDKSSIKLHVDLTEIHSQQSTVALHADIPADVTLGQINPVNVTVEQLPP